MTTTGKKVAALAVAVAAAVLAAGATAAAPEKPADLLFTNGAVYTVDAARSWADSVAVRAGRIVYVGPPAGAKAFQGPGTRVVDLKGRMLLPAFHDAHVHPVSGGMELALCNLNNAKDQGEVFDRIRRYVAAHPSEKWIEGGGWDLPVFPGANPTRQQLDAIVADRPASLSAADGHSSWVNTRALEIAGITRGTPDPPNGRIERDADGNPSGTLRESAQRLVDRHIPDPPPKAYVEGLRRGLEMANRFGITSLDRGKRGRRDPRRLRRGGTRGMAVGEGHRVALRRRAEGPGTSRRAGSKAPGIHARPSARDGCEDLRRRRHRVRNRRAAAAVPRPPGLLRQGAPRARGVRSPRHGARPRALPDPHSRHRRSRHPAFARRAGGRPKGQRPARRPAVRRASRADRPGRHPAVPRARRRRGLSAALGMGGSLHQGPDDSQARPGALALAVSDREASWRAGRSWPAAATGRSRR